VSDKLPPKWDRNLCGRWKTEVERYGQAYKGWIVARLLPPESSAVEQVSREVGQTASYRLTPRAPNNQNAEVSHKAMRMANSTPPTMGSAQMG